MAHAPDMGRKKRLKPTPEMMMGYAWVSMATILAFMKAHELAPADYFREYLRDKKALFRRIEAFQHDPANEQAIIAARHEAAEQLGRGLTKH